MSKIIIGLVGEKGSGKETFGNFLMDEAQGLPAGRQGKKIKRIRFSDLLNFTLKLWSLPQTRENLQDLAIIMDTGFGKGTLTHGISKQIEQLDADIVILDGVRWETDVMLIRSFPKNFLVYITADMRLRFKRLQKRKEKLQEADTLERFIKSEKAKNELLIPKIGSQADLKIENNGTFESLRNKVKNYFITTIQPS